MKNNRLSHLLFLMVALFGYSTSKADVKLYQPASKQVQSVILWLNEFEPYPDLKSSSIDVSTWAAKGVKFEGLVDILQDLLERRDSRVPLWKVAYALGSFQRSDSSKILISSLSNKDASLRREGALALGRLQATQAIKPLVNLALRDSDQNVRSNACVALTMFNNEEATNALQKCFNSNDATVAKIAKSHLYPEPKNPRSVNGTK